MCQCVSIVNTLFAPFQPDAHGVPLTDVVIRTACRDDLPFTAGLAAQREGAGVAEWTAIHGRQFEDDKRVLLVAERVYRRSLMQTGRKLSYREALRLAD